MRYRPIWRPIYCAPPEPPEGAAGAARYWSSWTARVSAAREDRPLRPIEAEALPLPPVTEDWKEDC